MIAECFDVESLESEEEGERREREGNRERGEEERSIERDCL